MGNNRTNGGSPYWQPKVKELPNDYIKDLDLGYYNKINGRQQLKSSMIIEHPKKIAERLGDRNKNKVTQIRKFYSYAKRIHESLYNRYDKEISFDELQADLYMLEPMAHNAYTKTNGTITKVFFDFISNNMKAVQDENDLDAFIKHFQAVIAYLPKEQY